jgi:uncharacterized protein YkwD
MRTKSDLVRTALLTILVLAAAACAGTETVTPTSSHTATATATQTATATIALSPTPTQTATSAHAATPTVALTATETPAPTFTPTATASPSPTPPATATATPTPSPTPTVDESCLKAAFIADVTVPDDTLLNPETPFAKTWRIRNTGTCAWSDTTRPIAWVFIGGAQMGGPDQVPISGTVLPGDTYDVTADLVAPLSAGQHTGWWQVQRVNGRIMSGPYWVQIQVKGKGITPTPTATRIEGGDPDSTPPAEPDATPPVASADAPPPEVAGWPQQVLDRINQARAEQNLQPLTYNTELAVAAQRHANDCSQRGWGSHEGSDGSTEEQRVQRTAYTGTQVDESWAMSSTPENAVAWWLDEAPPNDWHRRMLLSEEWTELGVGIAPASWGYYFIGVFGIP